MFTKYYLESCFFLAKSFVRMVDQFFSRMAFCASVRIARAIRRDDGTFFVYRMYPSYLLRSFYAPWLRSKISFNIVRLLVCPESILLTQPFNGLSYPFLDFGQPFNVLSLLFIFLGHRLTL